MKKLVVFLDLGFSVSFKQSTGIDFKDAVIPFLESQFGKGSVTTLKADDYNFELEIDDSNADASAAAVVDAIVQQFGLENFIGRGVNISCYNVTPEKPNILAAFFKKKNAPSFNEQVSLYKGLNDHLLYAVVGQDHAINTVVNGFIESRLFKDNNNDKPLVFFFAGPQKTGKTFIARETVNFLKMPCAEFSSFDYNDQRIEGRVAEFVNKNTSGALIFNDVENFNVEITRMLYFALTTGEYFGVNFRRMTIFLTTRCGRSLYEDSPRKNLSHFTSSDIIDSCRRDFNKLSGEPLIHPLLLVALSNERVVMLNHHEAINYQNILASFIKEYRDGFLRRTGVDIELDYKEYARLVMFSYPDEDDIEVLKRHAEELINKELEYLVKQSDGDKGSLLAKTDRITFKYDLENATQSVKDLFDVREYRVAVACSNEDLKILNKAAVENVSIIQVKSTNDLKLAAKEGIDLLLIDPLYDIRDKNRPADIEDYNSVGMDIFNYANKYYGKILLEIISNSKYEKSVSAYQTLLSKGANDVLFFSKEDITLLKESIIVSVKSFELERDVESLSRDNLHLTYNAKHVIKEDEVEVYLTKIALEPVDIYNYDRDETNLRRIKGFSDVIGASIAKEFLMNVSKFLSSTPEYLESGMLPPKLILINGYPGIGKTTLVKALAEETHSTIIKIDGKQVIIDGLNCLDVVKEAFKKARYSSPAIVHFENINCIIGAGESAVSIRMLETLGKEIEYCQTDVNHPVICIGECDPMYAVNDQLENSATRYFIIPPLNIEEREAFIRKYLNEKHITTISDEIIHNMALRIYRSSCKNFEYIARAIDFAIVYAQDKGGINDELMKESYDVFSVGDLSNLKSNDKEVLSTSYHEIGHYLVSRVFGEHPVFVTIVARGNYGGYTLSEISDDVRSMTKKDFLNSICDSFAGRAAEVIFGGEEKGINSGISGDIENATRMARAMITQAAMGKKLAQYNPNEIMYNSIEIYQEINEILEEQYQRALHILTINRKNLDILSLALFEKKSMIADELEELVPDDQLVLE